MPLPKQQSCYSQDFLHVEVFEPNIFADVMIVTISAFAKILFLSYLRCWSVWTKFICKCHDSDCSSLAKLLTKTISQAELIYNLSFVILRSLCIMRVQSLEIVFVIFAYFVQWISVINQSPCGPPCKEWAIGSASYSISLKKDVIKQTRKFKSCACREFWLLNNLQAMKLFC